MQNVQGVLARSQGQVQQMFERFEGGSPAEEADARFEHFQRRVWPRIRDSGSGGVNFVLRSPFIAAPPPAGTCQWTDMYFTLYVLSAGPPVCLWSNCRS